VDREDEKKYTLDEYSWHVINHLKEFDNTPEMIQDMRDRIVQYLPNHPILSKFVDYYDTALEYHSQHSQFPDMDYIKINYAKTGKLKVTDDEYSVQVVEDYFKLIEGEIIKREMAIATQSPRLDVSTLRALNGKIARFCDTAQAAPKLKKDDLINLYNDYGKDYGGIGTGIPEVDETCGVMGFKSLAVFGAPSGHGKSTFAISTAYNNVMAGKCVDYITYEVPREHIWFNLVAIHSAVIDYQNGIVDSTDPNRRAIDAADMKEAKLTKSQDAYFKEVMADMLREIKERGGYINVLDQTSAAVDTFEALKARIEAMATERVDGDNVFDRKADLIVVDNVDNFTVLKSSERDDMVRINKYIVDLDGFCKEYHHGDGTTILLLTQLNRGGLLRLQRAQKSEASYGDNTDQSESMGNVDVTVFQRFNALYEKSTYCLVGYADAAMRIGADARMNIYAVKLRNRPVPTKPMKIPSSYRYSRIGVPMLPRKATPEEVFEMMERLEAAEREGFDYKGIVQNDMFDDNDFLD
jgi:hypothetical protein